MTTDTQTTTTKKKNLTIRLIGPDGAALSIEAHAYKSGTARSFVRLLAAKNGTGTRTSSRGLSASHPTMAEAEKAVEAHKASALKQGWGLPVKRSRTVDAFTTIPAPGKAVTKK